MPLVFGAICPHPPILIPSIGQENLKKIAKTKEAMERLAEDFYHSSPDTVIVISPHSQIMAENFIINHSPKLVGDFSDFGDLETKLEYDNDIGLAYQIRESLETKIPIILTESEKLDHGILIPLYYLTKEIKELSVIPISYSLLDWQTHFNFGQGIRKILNQSSKRVAVIASGDLSHRLSENAPAGFSPQGKKFDQKLSKLLSEKKINEILKLDDNLINEAGECGFRSILILLGVFDGLNYDIELISYQGPFGVGYLVANFKIK